ncbi:translocation/assembly module TamB domain-containing protein [uncultured Zhongshania sp.]|uniref:translocation/assembly module TamB domain-containing protein n=1 Tax=uncultured Zhongshania sp. TaxID=1642288 RepID=UPI0025E5C74D|nr:translocation/assembly module TamB domain-containing protein [uncultured Zhongshania sp.]
MKPRTNSSKTPRLKQIYTTVATWLIRGILSCALLVITLLAAVYLILDTQRGSDWLLSKSLQYISPQATFSSYSGTLASGIQLKDLHLPLPAADIDIASIDSEWNLWGILSGELTVHKLHIDQLNIALNIDTEAPIEKLPSAWPNLGLPIPISVKDAKIENISIRNQDNIQTIERISLRAHSGLLSTSIKELAVKSKLYSATLKGRLRNHAPYKMHFNLSWLLNLEQQAEFSGNGELSGDLQQLRLKHTLTQPSEIIGDIAISNWYKASDAIVDINKIVLDAKFHWASIALPPQFNEVSDGQSSMPLLSSDKGHLRLHGKWDNYSMDFASELTAISPRANVSVGKPPLQDNTSPGAVISSALSKPGSVKLVLNGNKLALDLATLKLQTEVGNLEMAGKIDANGILETAIQQQSSSPVRWQLNLDANQIDTGDILPEWPITLAANIDSTGSWTEKAYQAEVTINQLAGDLANKTIAGSGAVSISNLGQEFKQLALQLGDNTLRADGKLTTKSELNWDINAPNLQQILPQLSGSLKSKGSLRGDAIKQLFDKGQTPVVNADLQLSELQYQQYAVRSANLNLNTTANASANIDLTSSGISASILNDATLKLSGRGTMQQHQLSLALDDKDKHLELDMSASLTQLKSQYRWISNIQNIVLDSKASGAWGLANTSKLELAAGNVILDTLCLTQDQTKVCADGKLQDDQLSTTGLIDSFPLAYFNASLPPGTALAGTVNSRFAITGKTDDLSGNLNLSSQDAIIRYQENEDQAAVDYRAVLNTKVDIQHNQLTSKTGFSIDDIGSITANIHTDGLQSDSQLNGDINGGFSNLLWLGGLFPQLEKLNGVLTANVVATGQLAAPKAEGSVKLTELAMGLPDLGISLKNAYATLSFDSEGPWQIDSKIQSGKGFLSVVGNGELGDSGGPSGQIQLRGEEFTALNIADGLVLISPSINIDLTPELIKIRGSLDIPKGNFTLKTLPEQAAGVSVDERIINKQSNKSLSQSRAIDTRIDISLNDSFEFKGYGLSTRLGGKLKVTQKPEGLLQAFGSLSLYDGVYQAYGQKLNVERGLLIFQGPLDNPGLNITAVRETKTVTVGVNIGGFAQDIRSELFSNPARPPTDVLAILITGKAPSDMNKSDANQVMNAATALGISQSRGITNTLQNTFGVDVITLQGGDTYEDSSLVVGKYLTPELFISYVQNLFTPAGSVQLDYSLSKNLGLKAQSGKAQSIDLLYKIEHGQH